MRNKNKIYRQLEAAGGPIKTFEDVGLGKEVRCYRLPQTFCFYFFRMEFSYAYLRKKGDIIMTLSQFIIPCQQILSKSRGQVFKTKF